jgi:hypothetical protein
MIVWIKFVGDFFMKTATIKISVGDKYGNWTVIDKASKSEHGFTHYKCECVCGHQLFITGASLYNGYRYRCANCFNQERMEKIKKREIGKIYNDWEIIDLIKVDCPERTKLAAIIKHICGFQKQTRDFYMLRFHAPRCKKCLPLKEDSLRRYESRKRNNHGPSGR